MPCAFPFQVVTDNRGNRVTPDRCGYAAAASTAELVKSPRQGLRRRLGGLGSRGERDKTVSLIKRCGLNLAFAYAAGYKVQMAVQAGEQALAKANCVMRSSGEATS